MGTPLRALLAATALLAAPSLQAESLGDWGGYVGLALPSGGTKQWVGSTAGAELAMTQTFSLGNKDGIRMRFSFWTLKANTSTSDNLILPGGTSSASYPMNATNEMYAFTYGAEYVRALPASFYILGGLGVTYVSATRTGNYNLAGGGGPNPVSASYSANNFVPYFCLGAGYQITQNIALEARWMTCTMKTQNRNIDLSNGGTDSYSSPGTVIFNKLNPTELTIGLAVIF